MALTREQIMERLQVDSVTVGTSRTDFWAAVVPERKMRNIVLIELVGDGVASRTVNIEKTEEDLTTHTMKFNTVPVAPSEIVPLPQSGYDIENPILVLEGGTQLTGIVNAGAGLPATVVYWDTDI